MLGASEGVSLDGSTIVGLGARNGNTEAFIAVIPDPARLGVLGVAGAVLMRRRGRVGN